MTSTPLIFLKPWSEVTIGSFRYNPVAAIIASGTLMDCFWRSRIAKSFISCRRSMAIHSLSKDLNLFFSDSFIFGQPSSSISVIIETATVWSRKGSVIGLPSCRAIKKFVSATKSIPFSADFFLVVKTLEATLQFPKVFTERLFLFITRRLGESLFHFRLRDRLFNFNYHRQR